MQHKNHINWRKRGVNVIILVCHKPAEPVIPTTFHIISKDTRILKHISFINPSFQAIRGIIKKFSASCSLEYPGMKSLPLFVNIISLHLDALSPSLFQFVYPFKIQVFILVRQGLIYYIFDTFIATEISITNVSFQLWEQIEVRRV